MKTFQCRTFISIQPLVIVASMKTSSSSRDIADFSSTIGGIVDNKCLVIKTMEEKLLLIRAIKRE
jgi:hypothetical protein